MAGGGGTDWSSSSSSPDPSSPGLGTQKLLQRARTELGEAQAKLIQQESALKELSDRGESVRAGHCLAP